MDLERIFAGVARRETCFQLLNRYQEVLRQRDGTVEANPHHGPIAAGQYFEIMESEYWTFLEALPPLCFITGGFAMSEYTTGDLTNGFFSIGGRHFCVTLSIPGAPDEAEQEVAAFEALTTARAALARAMAAEAFE